MKLIVTIVDGEDADDLITALVDQHIRVTHVSSSGGLLGPSNATLLIGLDDEQVPAAMNVITYMAATRQSVIPFAAYENTLTSASLTEVEVGGFLAFVLDVDHFEQV